MMHTYLEDDEEITFGSSENQYLLFYVGDDLYAIEALRANEIVEFSEITKVPMSQSCVRGVTNIRGNIVPVIDLLDRFSLGKTEVNVRTSIVVINHQENSDNMQIGVMIDAVYEVDDIDSSYIQEAPAFGSKIDKKFILHMGKYKHKYIPILNIDTILDVTELSQLAN